LLKLLSINKLSKCNPSIVTNKTKKQCKHRRNFRVSSPNESSEVKELLNVSAAFRHKNSLESHCSTAWLMKPRHSSFQLRKISSNQLIDRCDRRFDRRYAKLLFAETPEKFSFYPSSHTLFMLLLKACFLERRRGVTSLFRAVCKFACWLT